MKTHALLALLLLALPACSNTVDGGDQAQGGGDQAQGGGDQAQGGGDQAQGGGDPAVVLDLFACGVVADCQQDAGHLGELMTEEAVRCGGELVLSGEPGALLSTSDPGPYPSHYEQLSVLDGEGGMFIQTRSRCAYEGGCDEQNTTAWKLGALQRCTVDLDPATVSGCETGDEPCAWYGQGKDCVDVDPTWTCAALP